MNEIVLTKNATRVRWDRAIKDKAFDLLRDRLLLETFKAEHFLEALRQGTVSTNVHLRKRIPRIPLDTAAIPDGKVKPASANGIEISINSS